MGTRGTFAMGTVRCFAFSDCSFDAALPLGFTGVQATPDPILEPLPYHVELRDYLKSRERELWDWFASARAKADYTENLRMQLLKSTPR